MYLFYADESGTANSSHEPFVVLASFSIFERQTHWLDQEMTKIATRFDNKHFKHKICGNRINRNQSLIETSKL